MGWLGDPRLWWEEDQFGDLAEDGDEKATY